VHTNNDQENMVSRRVRTGFVRTINHQHNAKMVRRKSIAHPTCPRLLLCAPSTISITQNWCAGRALRTLQVRMC